MRKSLEYYLSLDYPVEIRRIDEQLGGGYIATIPCLGSQTFVGDGETPQEAYENLQVSKAEVFQECLDEGLQIPEPPPATEIGDYSGKLVVRMPRELHARLAKIAEKNNSSLNQFIVYALTSFEAKVDVVGRIGNMLTRARITWEQREPSGAWSEDIYDSKRLSIHYKGAEYGKQSIA